MVLVVGCQCESMKRAAKINIICSVVWLIITLAYFAFYYDEPLSIFTPLLGVALLFQGIPLVVIAAIVGIKGKSKMAPAVAAVVLAAAILSTTDS